MVLVEIDLERLGLYSRQRSRLRDSVMGLFDSVVSALLASRGGNGGAAGGNAGGQGGVGSAYGEGCEVGKGKNDRRSEQPKGKSPRTMATAKEKAGKRS